MKDYESKLVTIANHLREHPNDYQSKISLYKNHSRLIEQKRELKRIEKRKKIAEIKRSMQNEES